MEDGDLHICQRQLQMTQVHDRHGHTCMSQKASGDQLIEQNATLNCCYTLLLMTVHYPILITKQLLFKRDTSQYLLPVSEFPFKVLGTSLATAFFCWGQLVNQYSMYSHSNPLAHLQRIHLD